jgi:hypothetical protein
MITLTQHSLPPFEPLTSFLAYATGDEKVKLKDQTKQEGQRDERTGKADRRNAR